jgi:hypothetical protein
MKSWPIILGSAAAATIFLWNKFSDKVVASIGDYVKGSFSIQIAGAKVHKIGTSGLDLRLSVDLINLSPVELSIGDLKAFIFYLNNGASNHLATTSIPSQFKLPARDTSRISDIKVTVPYMSLLKNASILTRSPRDFKVTVSANVNGTSVQFSNTIQA